MPSESWPHTRSIYDAFGRVVVAYAEDDSITTTSYHALSTDVCDPLDNDPSSMHFRTCTTARTDGHGRLVDQILRNRQDAISPVQYHRLWTYYRNDGAVLRLTRAQTSTDAQTRPAVPGAATSDTTSTGGNLDLVTRVFVYDSVGRRIGSDDPDTDNRSADVPAGARSWRYLFNRAGDLIAVRDPRSCGQNFFYDLGGRLLGEQYVGCGEAQTSATELPIEELADAVAQVASTGGRTVDVQYFYDEEPEWIGPSGEHEPLDVPLPAGAALLGRATGVADRAQRAAVTYDDRGNAVWTARQVALIPSALALSADVGTIGGIDFPVVMETAPSVPGTVAYDWQHTYIRTAVFDHAGRPTDMALPRDPDWNAGSASTDPAPLVTGHLEYDDRGLPASASLQVGDNPAIPVVTAIHYLRDGLVDRIDYGRRDMQPVVTSRTEYDERRRPIHMSASRPATGTTGLRAITDIADQQLVWDAASNLTFIRDLRDPSQWPAGHRPQSVEIHHDSLYRVVSALFDYSTPGDTAGSTSLGTDESTNWRDSAGHGATSTSMGTGPNGVDPMRPDPAPMVTTAPPDRVQALVWSWDWLGNMTEWTDDAQQFYERSIGEIANGQDVAQRPSALYLAASIDPTSPEHSGWVELDYGDGGNVTAVTVHGQCSGGTDIGGSDISARRDHLRTTLTCTSEQHYQYRWDELNRISEARRFDRVGGSANAWTFEARQRYRYDGANVRVIKQSFDTSSAGVESGHTRVALFVYPSDFERRGLVVDGSMMTYAPVSEAAASTETQYLIAGARMVWDHAAAPAVGTDLDRTRRVTIPVGDLLHTTAASVDVLSGELLEVSTYYPNGARETLLLDGNGEGREGSPAVPLEPTGFTAKEADEDVGLVYFGERYLIARVGRWASPDPLHTHRSGGDEALNSFQYVSGNLLEGADSIGLCEDARDPRPCLGRSSSTMTAPSPIPRTERPTLPDGGTAGVIVGSAAGFIWGVIGARHPALGLLQFPLIQGDSPSRPPRPWQRDSSSAAAPPSSRSEFLRGLGTAFPLFSMLGGAWEAMPSTVAAGARHLRGPDVGDRVRIATQPVAPGSVTSWTHPLAFAMSRIYERLSYLRSRLTVAAAALDAGGPLLVARNDTPLDAAEMRALEGILDDELGTGHWQWAPTAASDHAEQALVEAAAGRSGEVAATNYICAGRCQPAIAQSSLRPVSPMRPSDITITPQPPSLLPPGGSLVAPRVQSEPEQSHGTDHH